MGMGIGGLGRRAISRQITTEDTQTDAKRGERGKGAASLRPRLRPGGIRRLPEPARAQTLAQHAGPRQPPHIQGEAQ